MSGLWPLSKRPKVTDNRQSQGAAASYAGHRQASSQEFFRLMESHRRNLRDIDYFHWSSQSWRDYWLD
eukprot:COSAG01_NODE_12341_length_1756_cov_2.331322_1_plen_67_part_10